MTLDSTEQESYNAFDTYRFYLGAVREHIEGEHQDWRGVARSFHDRMNNSTPVVSRDDDWIRRFWRIAWNTEFLLSLGPTDPPLLRISNQWTPIQAYYAVYAGAEVVGLLTGGSRPDGHAKALKMTTSFLLSQGITPFDKAFEGYRGRKGNEHRPRNFPTDIDFPHNLQRQGVDPLGMIGTCLRAEHLNRIDDNWRGKKQDGFKHAFDPKPTGILHFLWRLRVKANYRDVDVFLAQSDDAHIKGFSDSLRFIVACSLAAFETITARKCGSEFFASLVRNYLDSNDRAKDLKDRLTFYEGELWG